MPETRGKPHEPHRYSAWMHDDSDRDWDPMPDGLKTTLGDRLKKAIQYAGLSVGEIAEYIGAHRNSVSGWIAGRAKPMPIVLRVIADRCEVSYQWLTTGEWPQPTAPQPPRRGRPPGPTPRKINAREPKTKKR